MVNFVSLLHLLFGFSTKLERGGSKRLEESWMTAKGERAKRNRYEWNKSQQNYKDVIFSHSKPNI